MHPSKRGGGDREGKRKGEGKRCFERNLLTLMPMVWAGELPWLTGFNTKWTQSKSHSRLFHGVGSGDTESKNSSCNINSLSLWYVLSISWYSGCCNKISDKSNLGKEGLLWLRGQVMDYPNKENIVLGPWDHWADHIHSRDVGREAFGCLAHFLLFIHFWAPAHHMKMLTLRGDLPTPVSPVWKFHCD